MQTIIKDRGIIESPFKVASEFHPNERHVLLPLSVYAEHVEALEGRDDIGVWIDAGEEVGSLAPQIACLPVIGLNFPAFFDGRNLSTATLLRRDHGFTGELRAIGDVRRDQVLEMEHCGINAFELAPGQDPESVLAGLTPFTYNYQATIRRPEPLFRQR